MNAVDKWLELFPAWPRSMAEKFASVLECELVLYDGGYGQNFVENYNTNMNSTPRDFLEHAPQGNVYRNYTIFSPSNDRYRTSRSIESRQIYLRNFRDATGHVAAGRFADTGESLAAGSYDHQSEPQLATFIGPPPRFPLKINATFVYDYRLFPEFSADFRLEFYDTSGGTWVTAGLWYAPEQIFIVYIGTKIAPRFLSNPAPYSGADSIAALYENGLGNAGIDYTLFYEFYDFLNAYKKYSRQITQEAALSVQKSASEISDFKTELVKDGASEKARLDALKLQITNATENDLRSARRDLQNLYLNAQNLALNIKQNLR